MVGSLPLLSRSVCNYLKRGHEASGSFPRTPAGWKAGIPSPRPAVGLRRSHLPLNDALCYRTLEGIEDFEEFGGDAPARDGEGYLIM